MKQLWPPLPLVPDPGSSFWQRLSWCHSSLLWTIPLTLACLILWLASDCDAFVAILPLAFGLACLRVLWRTSREAWLGRHGQAASGEVTEIKTRRGATPIITVYYVRYRFPADGQIFTGELRSTRSTNWMLYNGEPVEVRYDPRDPRRNTLRSI